MRKTHKKVLGILGLVLVVATTIFAATLPSPNTSATGGGSVTDHITVRVVGSAPDITIKDIENNEVITSPSQSFGISYENVDNVIVTLEYTDKDGATHTVVLDTFASDGAPGAKDYNVDLNAAEYDYGDYILTVRGVGAGGVVVDEDSVAFSFYPVVADAEEDEETGNYEADLDYHQGGEEDSDKEVASIEVNVYDENGNLVEEMSPITVTPPQTKVELPFGDLGLPSGTYTVVVTSYGENGELLYTPYVFIIEYKATEIEVPKTADTGGLFQSLNISKTDYLITGLVVFFIVALGGAVFIVKNGKKSSAKSNRRR